ncbi:hypothetical protein [Oryza sativa Japonica Group]|uniref:Uncharacterized protein n=1 Tax=Oryza sativa subsp. japonica TaxID=39947 RepID=Q5JL83_ORYSJ|nr:hypothetical protein [Oryza sativa Japonica Group]
MVGPAWTPHNYSHPFSSSSSFGLSPSLHLSFPLPATERERRAAAPTGEEGAAQPSAATREAHAKDASILAFTKKLREAHHVLDRPPCR